MHHPFATGAPTDGVEVFDAGFAALTEEELKEITETTAKIADNAIFLNMV